MTQPPEVRPTPTPIRLPTERPAPFDPPAELERIRAEQPAARLAFPDGGEGWLFTRYDDVRAALADPRLSSASPRIVSPVRESVLTEEDLRTRRRTVLITDDPPEHTRLRRLLAGQFTVERTRRLEPWIQRVVDDHLTAMARGPRPADLVETFALPIPSLVICELLGVPYADRGGFQGNTATLFHLDSTREEVLAALDGLDGYMTELVRAKRRSPGNDLISGLVHAEAGGRPLTEDELVALANLLLIAGHETTANMIALGTFALLARRERWERLRTAPELAPKVVEELLRHLTIIHFGLVRVATERVELGGVTVEPGEPVVLHLAAANRDPEHFSDPDVTDFDRETIRHLTFGHGVHQCLGQQLARVEMRAALTGLVRRFPTLRLAVPVDQVPTRTDMALYGVHRLPVEWDD